jgi:hypothetical protein
MTTVDPTNGGANSVGSAQGADDPPPYSPGDISSSSGWGAFENYLGPKDFHVFKNNMCKAISDQIKHEQQRAQKASDQLKRSELGQDIYDD